MAYSFHIDAYKHLNDLKNLLKAINYRKTDIKFFINFKKKYC